MIFAIASTYAIIGFGILLYLVYRYPQKFDKYKDSELAAGLIVATFIWPLILLYSFLLRFIQNKRKEQLSEEQS